MFTQLFIQEQIKEKSKLRVSGLCAGNSPVTGEFPAQMASNAEKDSIWWRHHIYALPRSNWLPDCKSPLLLGWYNEDTTGIKTQPPPPVIK